MEQAVTLVSGTFSQSRITVALVEDDELEVEGYPNEYTQVVLNILTNARDAFREGNVDQPKVEIRIFRENGNAVVTVTDNAGGIEEAVAATLFEPYVTTKGPGQGTGLGLYMAKTIIERSMGGQLSVRNIGKGAEFRIAVGTGSAVPSGS